MYIDKNKVHTTPLTTHRQLGDVFALIGLYSPACGRGRFVRRIHFRPLFCKPESPKLIRIATTQGWQWWVILPATLYVTLLLTVYTTRYRSLVANRRSWVYPTRVTTRCMCHWVDGHVCFWGEITAKRHSWWCICIFVIHIICRCCFARLIFHALSRPAI